MKEFRDRVAVITGGANGIGRALAQRFGAEGMRIVLADIEDEALTKTLGKLDRLGVQAVGVRTDVSDTDDMARLAETTLRSFGRVDVVCNNAGVFSVRTFAETSLDVWRWIVDTNLFGVVHGCRTFLPVLHEQQSGHIVNTASVFGLCGAMGPSAYVSANAAVIGLSESLAFELHTASSPVKVSVLCPAFVRTDLAEANRNAPEAIKAEDEEMELTGLQRFSRLAYAAGLRPSVVADATFRALVEERFYVLPHPRAAAGAVTNRLTWMTEDVMSDVDWTAAIVP